MSAKGKKRAKKAEDLGKALRGMAPLTRPAWLTAAELLALEPISMQAIRRKAARLRRAVYEEQTGQRVDER